MKRDELLSLIVADLDSDGSGVGSAPEPIRDLGTSTSAPPHAAAPLVDAWEVHVPGALPGEQISVQVDHISSHGPVAWATLRTIDAPSPDRVAARCAAQGRCGGCVLQHLSVPAQVAWKDTRLRLQVAAQPLLAGVAIMPMVASASSLGYRNNSKLVAGRDASGRLILGGFAPRSHDVVDLRGCAITEPALEAVANGLRELLNARAVEPYDETRLTGVLRHVVLRASAAGQVLVTLVTAGEAFPAGAALAHEVRAHHPQVVGVVQNINPSRGNAIYGVQQRTLAGEPFLQDQIGDVRLRLSSRAFFQANRSVAAAAYQAIRRAAALTGQERVVDAYAGVGGIALTLAPAAATVVGIEEHPAAVADAVAGATLNGVTNARFVAGDVAAHLDAAGAADVVILNPPRKGCGPPVLRQAARLRPRTIAYLSCAPQTLLRDLLILGQLGYRTEQITAFDMLPHTPHVEALAILSPHAS